MRSICFLRGTQFRCVPSPNAVSGAVSLFAVAAGSFRNIIIENEIRDFKERFAFRSAPSQDLLAVWLPCAGREPQFYGANRTQSALKSGSKGIGGEEEIGEPASMRADAEDGGSAETSLLAERRFLPNVYCMSFS